MTIHVDSEIGQLRTVLVHRPGREIDSMAPGMMGELLFDDLLYGEQARAEHDSFCEILRRGGARVLEAADLLAEVLAEPGIRDELVRELEESGELEAAGRRALAELGPRELATALVEGVRNPASRESTETHLYDLPPVPNYFFQRDPQFVVNRRVFLAAMATRARSREPRLAETVFRHHPELAGHRSLFSIGRGTLRSDFPVGGSASGLEGGDVIVLDSETLLVGVSERTNLRGVERLAEFLRCEQTPLRSLIVVALPVRRSYMHLDTVFTLIDEGLALAYLPVIGPGRRLSAQVFSVDLEARELSFSLRESLGEALARSGAEVELVPCGGAADVLDQAREQWTDGANAFALRPGLIVLYRRNRLTIDELARRGWRIVEQEEVLSGRRSLEEPARTVVTLPGNELSRARGGPRCMTMPLERQPMGNN